MDKTGVEGLDSPRFKVGSEDSFLESNYFIFPALFQLIEMLICVTYFFEFE